ncbi:predicted protein [Histoplasma capsulatum G186AR]|uniref:Uncharacterized protein n=1 Tax=Ajellomyces capsulatus (strain G186AR / H82 / ATCC MYA-2454 / RMSCC 2432) TaxID=447093 RepID=C0NPE9_AJECG|nr:uncharacterized protein HCBG_05029 [Histoplasma capsulatum G186AR]EEH06809.1 predicted protein [Histoplasma capsulatum G186AR]
MLCVEMRSAVAWLDSPCGSRGSARLVLLRSVLLDKSNPWTGDVAKPRDRGRKNWKSSGGVSTITRGNQFKSFPERIGEAAENKA